MHLSIVVEGKTDEPVARRLSHDAGLEVHAVFIKGGKSQLDLALSKHASAAQTFPHLVLRDLDHDARCAVDWLSGKPTATWLCLRLAVRQVEAWLLADRESFSEFFKVRIGAIPRAWDSHENPKRLIVDLARSSTRSEVRRALVPARGAHVSVGPAYEAMIIEFATKRWRPANAARHSDSLRRARLALSRLSTQWRAHLEQV